MTTNPNVASDDGTMFPVMPTDEASLKQTDNYLKTIAFSRLRGRLQYLTRVSLEGPSRTDRTKEMVSAYEYDEAVRIANDLLTRLDASEAENASLKGHLMTINAAWNDTLGERWSKLAIVMSEARAFLAAEAEDK